MRVLIVSPSYFPEIGEYRGTFSKKEGVNGGITVHVSEFTVSFCFTELFP